MKIQKFDSKYLENGDRYDVGRPGALTRRTHGLSIGIAKFDLG